MKKKDIQHLLIYVNNIEAAESLCEKKLTLKALLKKLFSGTKSPSKKLLHDLKVNNIKEIRKILYKELKYID